jgi:hypothetical protein
MRSLTDTIGAQRKPVDARLSMDRVPTEFADHCHAERNHQGRGNKLPAVRRDSGLETNAGAGWRILLPFSVVLGHCAPSVVVEFTWLSWIGSRDEPGAPTVHQSHRLDGCQLAGMLCLLIFLRRIGGAGESAWCWFGFGENGGHLPSGSSLPCIPGLHPIPNDGAPLLPATAEGAIQGDDVGHFLAANLDQAQLGVEHLAFRIQVFEVAGDAALVAQIG